MASSGTCCCPNECCASVWAESLGDLAIKTTHFTLPNDFLESEVPIILSDSMPLSPFFVKLCSSSPRDAAFVSGGSLACASLADALLLLRASCNIQPDLDFAKQHNTSVHLVLKRFLSIERMTEFRVFLRDSEIVGISQRHVGSFFPQLKSKNFRLKLRDKISSLLDSALDRYAPLCEGEFAVDVYVSPDFRSAFFLDLARWDGLCDPLLFRDFTRLRADPDPDPDPTDAAPDAHECPFLYVRSDGGRDASETLCQVPVDLARLFLSPSCCLLRCH